MAFYEAVQEEFLSQAENESDGSQIVPSVTVLAMELSMLTKNSQVENIKSAKKIIGSGKKSSCKKRQDKKKIKEILKKEMALMDLAKKVHDCFSSPMTFIRSADKSAEKSDQMEIDTLLGEEHSSTVK